MPQQSLVRLMLEYAILLCFPGIMILAGVLDLMAMSIPNRISLVLFGGFFVVAIFAGLSWQAIGLHLLVGFTVLAIGIALFAFGLCGAGDSKLLAASSLWIGFEQIIPYFWNVSISGAVLAVFFLAYRSKVFEPVILLILKSRWAFFMSRPGGGIPYGIAIATGALIVFPSTALFQALAIQ